MFKNPNCPQCENNKRVIAHYMMTIPTPKLIDKEFFKCNACGEKFTGVRTKDPDKQMATIKAVAEVMAANKKAEEANKDKETVDENK